MGALQIMVEFLATLLSLLLITYISAFLYFCCHKLFKNGITKNTENDIVKYVGDGGNANTKTVFLIENERQLKDLNKLIERRKEKSYPKFVKLCDKDGKKYITLDL